MSFFGAGKMGGKHNSTHNTWVSQIKIIQKDVWLPKWSLINIWPREGDLSFSDPDSPGHDCLGFAKGCTCWLCWL